MTLQILFEYATSPRRGLISLPWHDQAKGIRRACAVRNTLLHGNFVQAAEDAGCASDEATSKTKMRAKSEVETMFRIVDHVMKQIDATTGRPFSPRH